MSDPGFLIPADKLAEPALLVTVRGDVLSANGAAMEEFGRDGPPGWSLAALAEDDGARLRSFLGLCAVSAEPIPGALALRDGREFRIDGFVLRPASVEAEAAICLRLRQRTDTNASFVVLNEKIAELSREIRERMRTEARLTDTLGERAALIQELHHRVRNALQVIASLASIEARRGEGPVARRLTVHANRAKAIGLIYKHMYGQDLLHVPIRGFVHEIGEEVSRSLGHHGILVDEDVGDMILRLDTAVPFALLVHELLVDALERAAGMKPVRVRLHRPDHAGLELTVAVDGGNGVRSPLPIQGVDLAGRLARQIRAEMQTSHDGLTVVRMPG